MPRSSLEIALAALERSHGKAERIVSLDDVRRIIAVYTQHQFEPEAALDELRRIADQAVDALIDDTD